MNFHGHVWDPKLILSQILTMQCLFYLTFGIILCIFDTILSVNLILDQMFLSHLWNTNTETGWIIICAALTNSLFGSIFLMWVVERAKKCLDFTLTVYIIYFLCCIIYGMGQFPSTVSWWITNSVSVILMAVLGEYLCQKKELKEIPLNRFSNSPLVMV